MAPPIKFFNRRAAGILLLGSLNLVVMGCGSPPATIDLAPPPVPPDKTVVTVNGEPISLDEFDTEFRLMIIHYSAVTEGDMRTIKRRLFEQVINRRLLVQEARKAGLKMTQAEVDGTLREALRDAPEDFDAVLKAQGITLEAWKKKMLQEHLARRLVDQEVNAKVVVTPAEAEDYYWSHLQDFWRPDAVRARHLVVRSHIDLQKALDGLKKGEDFAKIAATFSMGMERSQGGDWGAMTTDRISSEYLKALKGLKPGEISRPVKDEFGYHLFQLLEWIPRRMRPLSEVGGQIRDRLLKEEQDLRFDQWMADLKKKAIIRVNQDMAPVVGVTLEGLREE
ncbi:MAG TPA: peptidylprolyl isomerase [bacterium]|nr:peptidylprolyl isomerase [bacterium]